MIQSTVAAPEVLSSRPQSTFVTVVAWLFIVGAGFATAIALLQAVMFTYVMPDAHFWSGPGPAKGIDNLPPFSQFILSNIALFFAFMWALAATTFIAAIALLKRKSWARLYFIAFFILGIVWTMGSIPIQYMMMTTVPDASLNAPPEVHSDFKKMAMFMMAFNAVFSTGLAIVFAWMVKRLMSSAVRAEFHAP